MTRFIKGCIAFSLIALVVVIVLAINEDEPSFVRYNYVNESINQGALVLAVDSQGAITQTATGVVRGYKLNGEAVWEQSFTRFDSATNAVRSARAQCTTACPSAFLTLPERTIGVGGADPTGSLARALAGGESQLVQTIDDDSLFVNRNESSTTGLFTMFASSPGAPTQVSTGLRGAAYVGLSGDRKVAVAGLAGDDSAGAGLRLRQLKRSGASWRASGDSLALSKNANACISPRGNYTGIVDDQLRIVGEFDGSSRSVGPKVESGTCTIGDDGAVTLIHNPRGDTQTIVATRFSSSGKQRWSREHRGARLVSKAGALFYAVRDQTGRLSVFDAASGKPLLNDPLVGVPPGGGGLGIGLDAIVRADRKGQPTWLLKLPR